MNDLSKSFSMTDEIKSNSSMVDVASSRAEHEVQAAFVIAKKFPRNLNQCYIDIINSCKRSKLAETAMYAFPRGGQLVTGPSIRLAEMMAMCYGNLDCGIREISQEDGMAVAEAYAIDLQTHTRVSKVFHVKLERHTKKGITKLSDPRDKYELISNQGSRRLRSCILALIPGDITEDAVIQCGKTLESSDIPLAERVKKMVMAFDEFGINVEHLEARLGHNLDATIPSELVTLQSIYRSIKDGMADRSQFFDIKSKVAEDSKNELMDLLGIDEAKKEDKKKNDAIKDSE